MKTRWKKKRAPAAIAAGLLACALTVAGTCGVGGRAGVQSAPSAADGAASGVEEAVVARVVDGDTIAVTRADGTQAKVRLIGVDAPESVHPDASRNTQAGADASAHLKGALPEGAPVWLERDVSDTDKYGRLLRYVWTADPNAEGASFADDCLNAALVAGGWAQVKDYPPDTKRSAQLHGLEGESG